MNIQGNAGNPDPDEVKKQLDELVAAVARGELLPSQARITTGGVSMSIKDARKFLNLKDKPILYAVR